MTAEQHQHARDRALLSPAAGFVAGVAAAAVMSAVLMVGWAVRGQGLWTPINAIGSFFSVEGVVSPTFAGGITVLGLAIQGVVGGLLGALYASAIERMDTWSLLVVSLYYGGLIWIVSSFLLFVWLKPAFVPMARSWPMLVGSLAFGAVLGAVAAVRNRPIARTTSPD